MKNKLLGGLGWAVLTATLGYGQITETPDTVAPGRFLLEMDTLSLALNHDASGKYTAFGVASTFLTTGLTSNLDLQVGAELFLDQKFSSGGLTERNSGIGDVYLRTKWKFYDDATGRPSPCSPTSSCPPIPAAWATSRWRVASSCRGRPT